MRIVVTGASGFLGRAVLAKLSSGDGDYDCIGLSRRNKAGLVHVPSYAEAPSGDILIHLAEINDRGSANRLGAPYEAEAKFTLNALLAKSYARVIYASSAVLYGDRSNESRMESDPLYAIDSYTRIKLASENAVISKGGVVARLANLYGPGMGASNVLSHILQQIGRPGPVSLQDTTPVRDFLWIEDAADAILEMVKGSTDGVFNVGSGVGTSIRELSNVALMAAGQYGREVISIRSNTKLSSIVLNISKIVKHLNWHPSMNLHDGIVTLLQNARRHDTQ